MERTIFLIGVWSCVVGVIIFGVALFFTYGLQFGPYSMERFTWQSTAAYQRWYWVGYCGLTLAFLGSLALIFRE